jgi:glycosyltransferase involved in cell wall biosynthesis
MERSLAELIAHLADRVEFVVLSEELSEDLRAMAEWHRIRVPRRPIPLKLVCFCLLAGWKLARVRADLTHTTGAIVLNRADIATIHFCHAGFREAAGRLSTPGGSRLRQANRALERGLAQALERWCYRTSRLTALAAVSGGVAEELARHYPGVSVVVTPNGIDAERFKPDAGARSQERSLASVGPGDVVALFMGGDWDRKGLGLAIEGLARARSSGLSTLRLWVVGIGDEARFRGLAERLGVGDQVRFLGFRADPQHFYQAADIFVLPSLYESFSLVAHEAASSGLPIVATGCSGIRELVGSDDAGLLVERDARAIGEAFARLALDPELRETMGEKARRRSQGYTWERSVQSVLDLYRALLGPQNAEVAP